MKTWAFLGLILILLLSCGFTYGDGDYFQPAPPSNIIKKETNVSVSLTIPSSAFYINITEYDAEHMIRNVTVEFSEPITYLSFVIDVLTEKPYYVAAPNTVPVIQYYSIRFLTDLAGKIENITIVFSIEKNETKAADFEQVNILHYQYDGSKFQMCPIEKVDEDNAFLYFRTVVEGPNYFVVTGTVAPTPWWLVPAAIAVVALFAVAGVLVYRKTKLANSERQVRP